MISEAPCVKSHVAPVSGASVVRDGRGPSRARKSVPVTQRARFSCYDLSPLVFCRFTVHGSRFTTDASIVARRFERPR